MSTRKGQLKLGAFLMNTGHHIAGWRHPNAQADGGLNFAHYREVAQAAERAKFDMIFFADNVGIRNERNPQALSRVSQNLHFEPITLLSALSAVTDPIGLAATASTSFNEPFNLARKFASLDYLSGGRAAWNIVTSATDTEARNFGLGKHIDHSLRYERAAEFVQVVTGLWDSWDDDALVIDKESGIFLDPEKLHVLHHHGKHFSVEGPLNVARPVQGYPVLIQAGASDVGREFAATTAEVIFTAQQTLADAQEFYADIKGRVAKYGRSPEQLLIMPGIFPIVGRTEAEAQEKFDLLQSFIHPIVGRELLAGLAGGVDLSGYSPDDPLPDLPETNLNKSRLKLIVDLAGRGNLTIREVYSALATARGHRTIWGTPEQIADQLEEWFDNGAADGFNIMPPYLPGGLYDFIELVIPVLQQRGLFRTEYEGRTLRENLGLARPKNQFSASLAATPV